MADAAVHLTPESENSGSAPVAQTPADEKAAGGSYWHWPRMIVAWVATIVASAIVSTAVDAHLRFDWLLVVLAGATLLTFALQLGTAQRRGFIDRLAMSVAGSLLIVVVFSAVAVLVA